MILTKGDLACGMRVSTQIIESVIFINHKINIIRYNNIIYNIIELEP